MRGVAFTLLGFAVLFAALGFATEETRRGGRLSPREIRDGVRSTVEGQLGALRAGKLAIAYEFAARGLRRQFSAEVFAEMIRRGYPALVEHTRAEFGLVRDDGAGRAALDVTVFDGRDRPARFHYQLVQERAGWRIEGVIATRPPARGDT
ncbi:MAG: hypothetical protein C0518_02170 [Opitutus sp.]|nr:hypothetical protein [Opitutus sp.]